MAERPDPDTDRRNILPGEHAKPDGTWCPYLAPSNEAGVWVCMKCGNSGGVSTPATDPNTLADDIDQWAEADEANARNYSFVSTASTLSERAPDLRTAARLLREQAATADRLAAAERWRDAWKESAEMMEARARAAEARLAALTAAIGDPDELIANAHYGRAANGHGDDLFATVNRIAAAVAEGAEDRGQTNG